jgi:hypothetical protein
LKWKQIYQDQDLIKVDLKTAKHSGDKDDRVIALIHIIIDGSKRIKKGSISRMIKTWKICLSLESLTKIRMKK